MHYWQIIILTLRPNPSSRESGATCHSGHQGLHFLRVRISCMQQPSKDTTNIQDKPSSSTTTTSSSSTTTTSASSADVTTTTSSTASTTHIDDERDKQIKASTTHVDDEHDKQIKASPLFYVHVKILISHLLSLKQYPSHSGK